MDLKPKLLKLCNLLADNDETQNCPFCGKKEWGEQYHEEGCPFAYAYETREKILKYELKLKTIKNDNNKFTGGKTAIKN